MSESISNLSSKLGFLRPKSPLFKPVLTITGIVLGIFLITGGSAVVWAEQYNGKITPNVWIGETYVGNMDRESARQLVQRKVDIFLTEGVDVELEGREAVLPLSATDGDIIEYASFDVQEVLDEALNTNHHPNFLINTIAVLRGQLRSTRLEVPVLVNKEALVEGLSAAYPEATTPPKNATFSIQKSEDADWQVTVADGASGTGFDADSFFSTLQSNLESLTTTPIDLSVHEMEPEISVEDAQAAISAAKTLLSRAPIVLTYQEKEGEEEQKWEISAEELADLIEPKDNAKEHLTIPQEEFFTLLEPIAKDIEVPAKNARFTIDNGRVVEFVGSQTGKTIKREELYGMFTEAINGSATSIPLVLEVSEPEVATSEVNTLGIKEPLGVGTSSYKGSPANRIKNIRNGVNLLNGLLIAPGETFSLLDALSPFTYQNGYLPELVIKGDKIIPEIGGGLCQIGTTTFRAVMNAGLDVTERRNHSLAISYYNDPSNGNPGTDATIYDPAPDFKFKNDTEHYILFQAEMIEDTQDLRFTFWGTSDGRKGSYTPPVVHNWIPQGPTKEIISTDLAPGERTCQAGHAGANASFTYTVVRPDGTIEEEVYTSHYRALPQICLVGAAAEEPAPAEGPPNTEAPPSEESANTTP